MSITLWIFFLWKEKFIQITPTHHDSLMLVTRGKTGRTPVRGLLFTVFCNKRIKLHNFVLSEPVVILLKSSSCLLIAKALCAPFCPSLVQRLTRFSFPSVQVHRHRTAQTPLPPTHRGDAFITNVFPLATPERHTWSELKILFVNYWFSILLSTHFSPLCCEKHCDAPPFLCKTHTIRIRSKAASTREQ